MHTLSHRARRALYRIRVETIYAEYNRSLEEIKDRSMPGTWEGKAVNDLWDEIEDKLVRVHRELG